MARRSLRSFSELHPVAVAELRQARKRAVTRRLLRQVIGAAGPDVAGPDVGLIDALTARYHAAIESAEQLARDVVDAPGNFIREQAQKSADTFLEVASQARDYGLESVREAATVAAASLREWAGAVGEGFRSVWGVGPGTLLAGAGVLGLVALGGGGYLLLTGGGQALLTGAGTALAGAGKALLKAL